MLLLLRYLVGIHCVVVVGSCFINGGLSPSILRSNYVKFCSGLERHLILGDFDGNGIFNILCHDDSTGEMSLFNVQSSVSTNIKHKFCMGSPLFTADINGDRRYDLFCVTQGEKIKYLLNDETGIFNNDTVKELNTDFCNNVDDTFFTGDLNNDGYSDIICHHKQGNITYVYYNGDAFGNVETIQTDWCTMEGAKLLIGDFNGDKRSDLLCHSSNTGQKSILVTNATHALAQEAWNQIMSFCNEESSFLVISDINGDGRDDLICKGKGSLGLTTILRNQQPNNYFSNNYVYKHVFQFCSNGGERNFFTADFDGDRLGDLMCQTFTGIRQINLSRCYL